MAAAAPHFRVLFSGSFGSGKSTLISAYASGKPFKPQQQQKPSSSSSSSKPAETTTAAANPGEDAVAVTVKADGGGPRVTLHLVDTRGGEERFKTMSCALYRGTHAVVVAYDASDAESFAAAALWLDEARLYAPSGKTPAVLALVATKCDAAQQQKTTREQARELAAAHGVAADMCFETTATKPASLAPVLHAVAAACIAAQRGATSQQQPFAHAEQPERPLPTGTVVRLKRNGGGDSDACCALL